MKLSAPQLRHSDWRGDRRAHQIEIGSAYPGQQVRELSVKGRNLSEGVPRSFTLNSNENLDALQEPLQSIVSAVKQALEQTPPELGADVARSRHRTHRRRCTAARYRQGSSPKRPACRSSVADDPLLTCVRTRRRKDSRVMDAMGPVTSDSSSPARRGRIRSRRNEPTADRTRAPRPASGSRFYAVRIHRRHGSRPARRLAERGALSPAGRRLSVCSSR